MKSKAYAKKPEVLGKKSFLKAMREVGKMYFFLLTSSPFGYFSAGPMVRASPSKAEDVGLIPGRRAKILHASWLKNQNMKREAILWHQRFHD